MFLYSGWSHENNKGNAYLVPYFSSTYMNSAWKTDGRLQLRADIILSGLSLPWYVYQLTTVAVLKQQRCSLNAMKVTKNGATVSYGRCSIHLIHDYNTKRITVQVSTATEILAKSWRLLSETTKIVLDLLSNTWKATHIEVSVYCAHCLFLRDPDPDYHSNPHWFHPNSSQGKCADGSHVFESGVEPVVCMQCTARDKLLTPTVPGLLRSPCEWLFLINKCLAASIEQCC